MVCFISLCVQRLLLLLQMIHDMSCILNPRPHFADPLHIIDPDHTAALYRPVRKIFCALFLQFFRKGFRLPCFGKFQDSPDKHILCFRLPSAFSKENPEIPFFFLLFLFMDTCHHIVFQTDFFLPSDFSDLTYVFRQCCLFFHTLLTPFPIFRESEHFQIPLRGCMIIR